VRLKLILMAAWLSITPLTTAVVATAQYTVSQGVSDPKSVTVYVTRTGTKYHRAGCRSLAHSSIQITLADAKSRGYTPCKLCHPPE
jgi:hypothetical protein